MSDLLDGKMDIKPNIPQPDAKIGCISISVYITLLIIQLLYSKSTDTLFLLGIYIISPLIITGILGFIVTPKRAIVLGLLTVPLIFTLIELFNFIIDNLYQ